MAKYDVTYQCGHMGVIRLEGSRSSRERELQWHQENKLCPECWKAMQREKEQELVDSMGSLDLPALEGSEKQVDWANRIRAGILSDLQEPRTIVDYERIRREVALEVAKGITSARWWIDNRNDILFPINLRQLDGAKNELSNIITEVAAAHPFSIKVEIKGFKVVSASAENEVDSDALVSAIAKATGDMLETHNPLGSQWCGFTQNDLVIWASDIFKAIMAALEADAAAKERAADVGTPTGVSTNAKKPARSNWIRLLVNAQNIGARTDKAAMINMPKNSEWGGYSLWVSNKLLRDTGNPWIKSLVIKSDYTFTIKKYGKRKNVIKEAEVGAEDLCAAFEATTHTYSSYLDDMDAAYDETVEPDKIVVGVVEVPECLRNV
jgi:hypothetical protein